MPKDELRQYKSKRPRFKTSLDMTEGDTKLVDWGSDYLGCSKAEFIRTCIRAYSFNLQAIAKRIDG